MMIGWLALLPIYAPGQGQVVRYPTGDRATIVAILGGEFKSVWGPSGKVLKPSELPNRLQGIPVPSARYLREIVVQIDSGSPEAPAVSVGVGSGPIREAHPVVPISGAGRRHAWLAVGEANSDENSAIVRVGLGVGSWKTIGVAARDGGAVARSGVGFMKITRPWEYVAPGKGKLDIVISDVVLPTDMEGHAYRVQAITKTGRALPFHHMEADSGGIHEWFVGKYDDVAKVILQSRPLAWKAFPGVRLKPR